MTKTILITGLDGSGKSTLLQRLQKTLSPQAPQLLVPMIDTDALKDDPTLMKLAQANNDLNRLADDTHKSELKAIAIFGAMLLYQPICEVLMTPEPRCIIAERHPLVDTLAYAQFYAHKMDPSKLNMTKLEPLQHTFGALFQGLAAMLPQNPGGTDAPLAKIIHFIFDHFAVPGSHEEGLKVFKTTYPSEIYFLKAPVALLYERISTRATTEAHETLQALTTMDTVYSNILKDIHTKHLSKVHMVDASSFELLDQFYQKIERHLHTL